MPQTSPFTITLYSKALARQQGLGSALSVEVTPRWNAAGDCTLVLRGDDPAIPILNTPGCRAVVQYRGEVMLSGLVEQLTGPVVRGNTAAYTVRDDRQALDYVRAWIAPTANLTPSSLADAAQQVPLSGGHASGRADGLGFYAWPSTPAVYPAETAAKKVIADNLARFGSNVLQGKIVIQPDQGRGGDVRALGVLPQLRMDPLGSALTPMLEAANLGLRVWQDGSTVKLDTYTPATWTQQLGARSRIVTDGSYQLAIPTATRVILGGPGDDAARLYYQVADATGLEDLYGIAVEAYTDATGFSIKWPDGLAAAAQVAAYFLQRTDVDTTLQAGLLAYLQQTGAATLRDGGPTAGLDINLSETASFHYGGSDGYHVGDRITVQADNGGPAITQRITEATLSYSADGFSVTPKVGAIEQDPTSVLAKAVRHIASAVNRIRTRK